MYLTVLMRYGEKKKENVNTHNALGLIRLSLSVDTNLYFTQKPWSY